MPSPIRATHVALSWMTVLPLPQPRVPMDRTTGSAAMSVVPVVGLLLGAITAGIAIALSHTDLPTTMIGALLVVGLAAATRGMHLDGLADTADGLGCYGPPERVTEVMRSGSAGPFGVATLALVILLQAIGFGALTGQHRWYDIGFAVALGRVAAVVGARRGLEAAHPTGFGALVAGTQRAAVAGWVTVALLAAILGGFIGGTRGFDVTRAVQALIVVGVVVAGAWWFTAHCARRAGGVTGDSLGAAIELGVTLSVVGLLV